MTSKRDFRKTSGPKLPPSLSPISRTRIFAAVGALVIIGIFIAGWSLTIHYRHKRAAVIDLATLVRNTRSAVVLVEVFDDKRNEIASGSGFFVSDNGLLITNCHVIENAASAVAKIESGDVLPIKGAVNLDRKNDLALLMVERERMPFLTLGESKSVEAGDHIAVIGSPLGLVGSVSEGIVSAKREEANGARQWLQISASISHGSSGSPVLNASGKVIGVATMSLRGGQSLNFAVPAELVAAMLQSRKRGPSAAIPLQALARASALNNAATELDVLRETDRALAKAQFRRHRSVGRYNQADLGKALQAAKTLAAKYPDSGSAYADLGDLYEQMGLSEEAISAYQHAVKINRADAESWASLGFIYTEKGDVTEAGAAFAQAIAYQTERVQSQIWTAGTAGGKGTSLWLLGEYYRWAGNNKGAEQSYLRAIREDPDDAMTTASLASLVEIYLTDGNEKAGFDIAYQIVLLNQNHQNPEAEAWDFLAGWYYSHHREADGYRCKVNAERLGSPH